MTALGKLSFHPEIFAVIGEQLVSDQAIALSELVKNSYDADATIVTIKLNIEKNDKIIISDNGHGMTMKDITNGWLVIGTSNKRRRLYSKKKKRVLTGSMGIGRFATFLLANILEIETSTNKGPIRKITLNLNIIKSLDDITDYEIPIEIKENKLKKSGTKVTLSDLKWFPSNKEINRVKTRLSILCSPRNKSDFKIIMDINGKKITLDPKKELPAPPITAEARFDKNNNIKMTVTGNPQLYIGKLKRKRYEQTISHEFKYLNKVKIETYWYPLGERPQIKYWDVSTRGTFATDMRTELSGVRVYRDGIRVLPYGEPANDWLDLERTYVSQGSSARNPRRTGVIAWVYISRKNNRELIDTANREGLQENVAYQELTTFCKALFSFVAEYRREVEPRVPREQTLTQEDEEATKDAIEQVKEAIQSTENLREDTQLSDSVSRIEEYLNLVTFRIEDESLYRDRLTAGNMLNHIIHDVGSACTEAIDYIEVVSSLVCNQDSHKAAFETINDLLPRISSAYGILKGGSLAGSQRKTEVNISSLAQKLINQILQISYFKPEQIKFKSEIIIANLRSSDLWAILANLLLNSITCQDFTHARERNYPSKSKRRIHLSFRTKGNDLIILCEDNGPGLPDKPEGWIWLPFNSTRKGGGSGLGLSIISDVVTYYSGTKFAGNSTRYKTGAKFEFLLKDVVIND